MTEPVITGMSITDLSKRTAPYLDVKEWAVGAYLKWRVIVACAFVNLVVSNGLEVTAKSLDWTWLSALADGMGMTWKAAVVQGFLHAIWTGATHIAGQEAVDNS